MEKPKIYATGNFSLNEPCNISYYIVEKDKKFLDWLGQLLEEVLEIEKGSSMAKFVIKEDEDHNEILYAKEINKMIDIHEKYVNNKSQDRVDLFYGKNRVHLTLITKDNREKFIQFVKKTKTWISLKEIPMLQPYLKIKKKN